jgi:gliding motility-associated lipoprotein GldH
MLRLILALGLGLAACHKPVYQHQVSLKDGLWTYADSVVFEPEIQDTQQTYDIYLQLSHQKDYPFANAYCELEIQFPQGKPRKELVSIELADEVGKWLGKCSGSSCQRSISFLEKAKFEQIGKYKIIFRQYGRQDSLQGIQNIGLRIDKTPKS